MNEKNTMTRSTTIIGIAGASGAGKSLLARQLHARMRDRFSNRDVAILNEDSYYRRRDELSLGDREKINFDHPSAFEHELLVKHLNELRNGNSVDVPQYDYAQHNRSSDVITMESSKVIILEGILILHDSELRDSLDLKIFVDVPLDVCLSRRLRRDIEERGRSLESVLNQYHSTVRPMFAEFIEPSKSYADIIVPRGGENEAALVVLQNHLDCVLSGVDN
jgi:uridine kinase